VPHTWKVQDVLIAFLFSAAEAEAVERVRINKMRMVGEIK
jgi:hypothetical protein